jgi:hypothetical protein
MASAAAAPELNAGSLPAQENAPKIPTRPKAVASLPSLPARKSAAVGAAPVEIDSIGRTRTTPVAAASVAASKEQFFEAP